MLSVAKLSVVAYRFNWTTGQRLFTLRSLFLGLWLLIDERIIILIAAREIIRRGVATDIAIDARAVHVKRAADVLFNFIVLIRHASGMSHLFGNHHRVKLFPG